MSSEVICTNKELDVTLNDCIYDTGKDQSCATRQPAHCNGPDQDLSLWLQEVGNKFRSLSTDDRCRTLDYIIGVCESGQLYHLSVQLDMLLRRDFLVLLPPDLVFHLVRFLDARSLTVCCLVSRRWNAVISTCSGAWRAAARHRGADLSGQQPGNTHAFKELFLMASHYVKELNAGRAFDRSVMYGHQARVMTVYYHDDIIATGSDDHTVRFWDCSTGMCTHVIHTQNTVALVKFDADKLVTASFNTTAALWSVSTGAQLQVFVGHVGAVFSVDFTSHTDLLVTGSADSTVKLWVLSTGHLVVTLPHYRTAWITQVCLHRAPTEASYSVLSRDDEGIHMWRLTGNHQVTSSRQIDLPEGSALLPGWQIHNSTLIYMTHCAPSTYHLAKLDLSNGISILTEVNLHKAVPQGFLGCGLVFCVLIHAVDGERSEVTIIHHTSGKVIATVPMPYDYRPSKRNATFTLGSRTWLDGFPAGGEKGTFLLSVLRDNSILQLRWRPTLRKADYQ